MCNHENNVPSQLSLQWLYGNSLVEQSLVHWYQQCVTVHHVPKCMSYHEAIVVITERAHCFHDYI